jgi:DNA polymerase theta
MELWGIGADMDACLRARHIIIKKLKELEKEAYRLAGKSFSLNATADIADILYTHLKLPVPKGCEKGKLHPSTDKQSLDHLRYSHSFQLVILVSDVRSGSFGATCCIILQQNIICRKNFILFCHIFFYYKIYLPVCPVCM